MTGFLYYLPGKEAGLSTAVAAALGLGYALDGPLTTVGVRGGPDGGDGCLAALAAQVAPEQLGYHADRQTWREIPASPNCRGPAPWVGIYNSPDLSPMPDDLARPKQLDGHPVVLGDDRAWLVPVARGWTEEDGELRWYHKLPQGSVLGEDGRWAEGEVLPRFAPLWDLAMRYEDAWQQAILGAGDEGRGAEDGTVKVAFDFDGLHNAAAEILSHNYRIGPAEADLLGLLTVDISREILEATIDLPTRIRLLEKRSAPPDAESPAAIPAAGP